MNIVDLIPIIFVIGVFSIVCGYTIFEFARSRFL